MPNNINNSSSPNGAFQTTTSIYKIQDCPSLPGKTPNKTSVIHLTKNKGLKYCPFGSRSPFSFYLPPKGGLQLVITRFDEKNHPKIRKIVPFTTKEAKKIVDYYQFRSKGPMLRVNNPTKWQSQLFKEEAHTTKLKSALNYFGLSKSLFGDLFMGVWSAWGVIQPTVSGFLGDFFDVGGPIFSLFSEGANLPVIKQVNTFFGSSVKGLFIEKLYKGNDKWSLKCALSNALPEQGGITFNKEKRIDSGVSQLRSTVSLVGSTAGLAAKIGVVTGLTGTAVASGISIVGTAFLLGSSALGLGYHVYKGHRIHQFQKTFASPFHGKTTNGKMNRAFNALLDEVWLTPLEIKKVEEEIANSILTPSFFERHLQSDKTGMERYEEKIEKILKNKESHYLKRAGKRSFKVLQDEAKKRFDAKISHEIYKPLSIREQRKIVHQMESECRFQKIERVFNVMIFSCVSMAYISLIASVASSQYYLLSLTFVFFLVAAMLSAVLAARALYKYYKTKDAGASLEGNPSIATGMDGNFPIGR